MIGETLAHFKITDKLGEGGMGEVYRAQDTKLGREVAIKVLPELFAQDAERMARFTREAQVLASLNHPGIAAIYQVEHDADRHFLVMELVEGETLAERIKRGRIPVDEAMVIALQVAEALEAAHNQGIVHRDLKPANINFTETGKIKVLDFGLAKALEAGAGADSSPSHPSLSLSPTMTAQMTGVGVLMGTAAYMSPEQARGEPVDRRADIWAFGVVLMEMLTGQTVYAGKTMSDTLAGILAREPEWNQLPDDLPPRVRNLLDRCLQKETQDRLQAVGEARIAIAGYLADPEAAKLEGAATAYNPQPAWKRALPWAALALAGIATAVAIAGWNRTPEVPPQQSLRLNVELPAERPVFRGFGSSTMLSPDGQQLAYVLNDAGTYEIFLHSLDQWDGVSVVRAEGPDRPYQPFFSPDGNWLGFVTPSELKKVPVKGGTPITLCEVNLCRGASWGADGWIVFAGSPNGGLSRVPAAGGDPEALTELDSDNGELSHRWPQVLPNGKAVLFTSIGGTGNDASIHVLDLESGQRQLVKEGGSYGRYVESGHVVYADSGTLFAIPFDLASLSVTGSAVPVVEGVTASSSEHDSQFSSSPDGKLAYLTGAAGQTTLTQILIDRDGQIEEVGVDPGEFYNPRFSPDGARLAVGLQTGENLDIWVYDLERKVPMRLTFNEGGDQYPIWSPDGSAVYYSAERDGEIDIYRRDPSGSGEAEKVLERAGPQWPSSFSPDGTTLAFGEFLPETEADIWLLPMTDEGEPQPLVVTEFTEYGPEYSPDGRWIAYGSDETGNFEVYVTSASGDGKWQVTNGGGAWPLWAPDGRSLAFVWESTVSEASVDTGDGELRLGRPKPLFTANFRFLADGNRYYDVSPDGTSFLMLQDQSQASDSDHEHIRVVLNWFDELNATFAQFEQ